MTLAAREEAITTLHNFIGNMRPGDRIGIVYFDTNYALYGSMTSISDDVEIQQMLEVADINLRNGSLGGDYGSYVQAFGGVADMISQTNDIGNKRTVFVLTNDTECYFMEHQVSQLAANYGFTGNIVLMANTPQGPFVYGSPAARAAGGTFYEYGQSSSLWNLFYAEHGKVEDFSDSDDDGLADFMEEQGMRTTNGLTIRTLTNSAYSDADTLPDGIEMGQMYTITNNEGIITIKPDHTLMNDDLAYVDMTAIEGKGPAYIFAIFSNPTVNDTDFDGATDDIDATPRDTNQPVNYIIYGEDNAGDNTISIGFEAYKNAMQKEMKNDGIETIYIQCGDTKSIFHKYFWPKMNHEYLSDERLLNENTFGDKIAYSYVNELIIISHGAENGIAFGGGENFINIVDIYGTISVKTPCRIKNLDIEACNCAREIELSPKVCTSVAKEFLRSPLIDNVYAWKGSAVTNRIGDPYNYSKDYNQFGDKIAQSCGYYAYWMDGEVVNEHYFFDYHGTGWLPFLCYRTAVPLLLRRES